MNVYEHGQPPYGPPLSPESKSLFWGKMQLSFVYVQYWKMDLDVYEHGQPPYGPPLSPDFCLGHWQTQCRATFEAPVDPNLVLGGFPSGPEFRNYSADATAFVVTYPVDSSEDNRC